MASHFDDQTMGDIIQEGPGPPEPKGPRRRRAGTPYYPRKTYGAMVYDEMAERRKYKSFHPAPEERQRLQEFFECGFYYTYQNYTYTIKGWENEGSRQGNCLDFDKLMVPDLSQ